MQIIPIVQGAMAAYCLTKPRPRVISCWKLNMDGWWSLSGQPWYICLTPVANIHTDALYGYGQKCWSCSACCWLRSTPGPQISLSASHPCSPCGCCRIEEYFALAILLLNLIIMLLISRWKCLLSNCRRISITAETVIHRKIWVFTLFLHLS